MDMPDLGSSDFEDLFDDCFISVVGPTIAIFVENSSEIFRFFQHYFQDPKPQKPGF